MGKQRKRSGQAKFYGAEYVGFKQAVLTEEQHAIIDSFDEVKDLPHALVHLTLATDYGYKVSMKILAEDHYAADVMMMDDQSPAAGYMLRSEGETLGEAVCSLLLKLKAVEFDISKYPDAGTGKRSKRR